MSADQKKSSLDEPITVAEKNKILRDILFKLSMMSIGLMKYTDPI